jgi:hypothetical protein
MINITILFLFFIAIHFVPLVRTAVATPAVFSMTTNHEIVEELLKAGWRKKAAQAVASVNQKWFYRLKTEKNSENHFQHQIERLKQLKPSYLVSRFLEKHPETAGLLALSKQPILIIKVLKKPACYNALITSYALHTTPQEIQLLTEALTRHRDLLCQLTERGMIGTEMIFMFPRQTRGAKEYDLWLKKVFSKYLRRSDNQLAQIMAFLIEHGQDIRQRLEEDKAFYQQFRQQLWFKLMRLVDNIGNFNALVSEPYIWDVLSLNEGELLLEKWGIGPVSLLFGTGSYPANMRSIIIQILLQGDDNTVDALFKYQDQPLFHQLLHRQLSASTQAALANRLATLCPNYPEQSCPELPEHLNYLSSIMDNVALAEEVGPKPTGPITWLPFHGSYRALKKMTQGRKMDGQDIFNLSLDALIFVPAGLFAIPFSQTARPLTAKVIIVGLDLTPRTYHLIKPLGKIAIRTGTSTGKLLTQSFAKTMIEKVIFEPVPKDTLLELITPDTVVINQSQSSISQVKQKLEHSVSIQLTEQLQLFSQKTGYQSLTGLAQFQPEIYLRHDTKLVIIPTHGINLDFFQETAHQALLGERIKEKGEREKFTGWQQNISAWWLMMNDEFLRLRFGSPR